MYYSYVLIYRREWGEIRQYFFNRSEADKANESGAYAGCGTGIVQPCHRDAKLSDYERVHW